MAYHSFEDLLVWQRSCTVAERVYVLFKETREYSFKDQVARSSISIPSNIAEGAERNHAGKFKHFLGIAKGSAAELRTQLELASRMKIIKREQGDNLIKELKEISAMLHSLMLKISSPS